MKKLFYLFSVLAITSTAGAQGSVEAMLSYVGSSPTNSGPVYSLISAGNNQTLGWTFQPLTDISVTALGAFSYVLQNSGSLKIGLWNSSGTLLASNTVSITGTSGDRVYSSITPVMLLAGQTYFLGDQSASTQYFYVVGPDSEQGGYASMSPEIQLGLAAYTSNAGFDFPSTTTGSPGDAIVSPNFQFQVVPEPSALGLLGSGAIAWLLIRQRQNLTAIN